MPDCNGLRIDEVAVELHTAPGRDRLKAFAKVLLNGVLVIANMRVLQAYDGRVFVAMPSRKKPDGTYTDVAFPIHAAGRRWLQDAVLAEYRAEVARRAAQAVQLKEAV